MPRALLVTMAFPSVAGPSSFGAARTLHGLPGWTVDVVTVNPEACALAADHCLDDYVRSGFGEILRVPAPGWARNRVVRRGWMALAAASHVPDLWYLAGPLVTAARRLELGRYDALITWSQQHAAHLAGCRLHPFMKNARWLARLGDPWSGNPFALRVPWGDAVDRLFERRVFAMADRIVFPSEEMRAHAVSAQPDAIAEKSAVLSHAYDESLYPPDSGSESPGGAYCVRCMGKHYGPRSPEPVFRAVNRLCQHDGSYAGRLRIEFYGTMGGYARTLGQYPAAAACIHVHPPVPYRESLRLMRGADCLLTVDAPSEESLFFPSKLVDYIGADRFLAAITPTGPTARIVAASGGWSADPADAAGCEALFARLVRECPRAGPAGRGAYAKDTVQQRLAQLLLA